jgi:hypothetical protein
MTKNLRVRHANVEGISPERFRGRADRPLTAEGRRQAEATARRIQATWPPSAVYASPLSRARETAVAIGRPFGLAPIPLERLADVSNSLPSDNVTSAQLHPCTGQALELSHSYSDVPKKLRLLPTAALQLRFCGVPRTQRAGNPPYISSIPKAVERIAFADAWDFRRRGPPFGAQGDRALRCPHRRQSAGLGLSVRCVLQVSAAVSDRSDRLWLRSAARGRRGSHRGDRQHPPQVDAGGQAPITVGFFFSLGHSTVVAASLIIALTGSSMQQRFPELIEVGGVVGTLVSVFFLIGIAIINFFVLMGVCRRFQRVRQGESYTEEELNVFLSPRGLFGRLLRGVFRLISRSWHMYPLGFLFGLGSIHTEIGVLGISAAEASRDCPSGRSWCSPRRLPRGCRWSTAATVCWSSAPMVGRSRTRCASSTTIWRSPASVVVAVLVGAKEALGLSGIIRSGRRLVGLCRCHRDSFRSARVFRGRRIRSGLRLFCDLPAMGYRRTPILDNL